MRLIVFAFLAAVLVLMPSCAEQQEDPNRVSTIPWNRPERWEGQGPLGAMNPENRY